jgi:hypothetical protein
MVGVWTRFGFAIAPPHRTVGAHRMFNTVTTTGQRRLVWSVRTRATAAGGSVPPLRLSAFAPVVPSRRAGYGNHSAHWQMCGPSAALRAIGEQARQRRPDSAAEPRPAVPPRFRRRQPRRRGAPVRGQLGRPIAAERDRPPQRRRTSAAWQYDGSSNCGSSGRLVRPSAARPAPLEGSSWLGRLGSAGAHRCRTQGRRVPLGAGRAWRWPPPAWWKGREATRPAWRRR